MNFFPESNSVIGSEIDHLFWIITTIVTIAAVITLFLFLYPLFRRNKAKTNEELYAIGKTHKSRKWIYLGMLLLLLGDTYILFAEHHIWNEVELTLPEPDFKVAIVGKQWMWQIIYPGVDNVLYTADDVIKTNELHIPIDRVIHLDIKALDVVHSVFLPQTRFKQDALPGRTITRWIKLNKAGRFDLTCAEICGMGHTYMKGTVIAEDPDTWQKSMNKIYKIE